MAAPSLQDGIDQAGSPVRLLWRVNPAPWNPENIEPEYAGWRQEQAAWHTGVSLSDLSHHMFDTVIEGPGATRLLAAVSANNYVSLATDPSSAFRGGGDPGLFRYQVQGRWRAIWWRRCSAGRCRRRSSSTPFRSRWTG